MQPKNVSSDTFTYEATGTMPGSAQQHFAKCEGLAPLLKERIQILVDVLSPLHRKIKYNGYHACCSMLVLMPD